MPKSKLNGSLLASTLIAGFAIASPAFAQTAPPPPGDTTSTDANSQAQTQSQTTDPTPPSAPDQGEIVVTGTITRNPAAATASPVVSVTADDIQKRGITTVTEYLQTLSANNAGTVPPSWSSFGFTTGASAPSLRGFNDAYTLVLFDGMRSAVYPLADDTQRNITDINTIPAWSVARIDTLLDGASSTYGSDAIAGVVNVITKSELRGVHGNASYGISQRGDGDEKRFSLAYGFGSLADDGYNIYAGVEWQKNDALFSRDRGYPFNSEDLSGICGTPEQGCLTNFVRNGIQYDGSYLNFQASAASAVQPFDPADVTPDGFDADDALAGFQYLAGCNAPGTTPFTLSADQAIPGLTPADNIVCQQDRLKQYQMYNSPITRKGAAIRGTKRFGDHEVFASFNYYNAKTYNSGTPGNMTAPTAAGGRIVSLTGIFLPVYVCPQGTAVVGTNPTTGNIEGPVIASGCQNPDGTPVAGAVLNPNNPFAAEGQVARLFARLPQPLVTTTNAKTYRAAIGAHGEFGAGWSYNVGATASRVNLDVVNRNYLFLQGLLDAIAQGTYNFIDQNANSQAAIDQVFPEESSRKTSKMWQVQGALSKDFIELPGGMLNVAVGGQYRHESLNNPSDNPPNDANPYARYFTINAVGVKGSRNVWSLSYEVAAPILDTLRVKASGSYDHYSTGQSAFSPKFEAEWRVIQELKLRGTASKGFRAPNFNESFQLPSTGYTSATIVCSNPTFAAFCAAHASNPSYYQGVYAPGLTSSGNPDLDPEKSTGYTLGAVFQPRRNLTFTVDFWRTKIKDVIVPPSVTDEITEQYYTNNGVVNIPGITVIPGPVDPQNPTALPLLGFIQAPFQNANAFLGKGIDFSANVRLPLFSGISLRSLLTASYLLKLQQIQADGTVYRADGSLGPCGWTSCSGAPKWRATWQNTFDVSERFNFTLTGNYTSGYSSTAADSGGVYRDCIQSALNGQLVTYDNGDPVQCYGPSTFWVDVHAEYKPTSFLTIYGDVLNLFDRKPGLDVNAGYSIYQFNPAWQDRLFMGRYFRFGARVDLEPARAAPAPYVAPAAPPPPPETITCPGGSVVAAGAACPVEAPPPPPPPATSGERGR
jgi:iron complex outermembrane recepter protein